MRRKKTLRPARERQQSVDAFFPGTGAPPDPRISFPRHDAPSPEKTSFSKATSDQIREELRFHEEQLRYLREVFPRVTTGTLAELNEAEDQAANKMEAHQRLIEALRLELISRGGNPASPTVLAEPEAVPEEAEEFKHSEDFRSIQWLGESYSLTSRQADVVQMLWEAHRQGTPALSTASILEKLGTPSSRLRDTFRRSQLWDRLIVGGGKRGTVQLNLSPPPKPRS